MAEQVINVGAEANDGTGDSLRLAFTKTKENFAELYVVTDANTTAIDELSYNDLSDLPALGTASAETVGSAEGEVPTLGVGGKLGFAQLPTGTGAAEVAVGNHDHPEFADIAIALADVADQIEAING